MSSYLHILPPITSFTVNVICQVCLFRYINNLGLLKSVFVAFALGICSLIFIESYYLTQASLSLPEFIPSIFTNIIIYSALGYCYFHFINLGETARRIRVLRELYDSKEGLSMEEILKRYNAKNLIETRINRLINNGQVISRGNRYYIGRPVVLTMAKIILIMKLIIIGKRSHDFN